VFVWVVERGRRGREGEGSIPDIFLRGALMGGEIKVEEEEEEMR